MCHPLHTGLRLCHGYDRQYSPAVRRPQAKKPSARRSLGAAGPGTGFLVWDPLNKGEITSGRQLFGTATWWLLFPDGYAALSALDDSRDGSLSGPELKGISVWFDKNANGRSEPGEVQPVASFGVQAIRTRPTGSDHGMLMNANGLVLKNGAAIPTYDWLVSPVTRSPCVTPQPMPARE
jgi:hypothetical protein